MTGRYQKYSEYKKSGVDWLHEIPKHWKTIPIGRCYRRLKRTGFENEELLSVYRDHGVIPKSSRDDNNNKPSDDLTPYQLVCEKNLVMNKMKAWQGSIAISQYRGIVSPAYFVYEQLKQTESIVFPKYVHYLLRHPIYIAQYLSRSKGIRVNQWDLDPDEFQRIELLLPEKDEQIKIINFLDHETAKIDILIAKQEKLIELLKEKRQAVISHAVTRGLNPNAPMKDSGVEWLGDVPKHWNIARIKQIVSVPVTDGPHETPTFVEEGVPFLSAEGVSAGFVNLKKARGYITEELNKIYSKKYTPKLHDIYMVKSGATTGVTAIVETENKFNIWSPLAAIRCKGEYSPYFVFNFMKSREFQKAVELNWSFGTQQNIGMGIIENLHVPCPPKSEAIEIAEYIKIKSDRFNRLIKMSNKQINLIKERKTALVSAAVTGKIDVRNWSQK